MKKEILFMALALLISAGVSGQDQLRTNLKTQDKDQLKTRDKDQIHTPVTDQLSDQDKDQLRTRDKDQLHISADQLRDKDQLKTRDKDQTRLDTKTTVPAQGAMRNAGAAGTRMVQTPAAAAKQVKAGTPSGMGPKRR